MGQGKGEQRGDVWMQCTRHNGVLQAIDAAALLSSPAQCSHQVHTQAAAVHAHPPQQQQQQQQQYCRCFGPCPAAVQKVTHLLQLS
jgi:hypothetical protein